MGQDSPVSGKKSNKIFLFIVSIIILVGIFLAIFLIISSKNNTPENELINGGSSDVTDNVTEKFEFIFDKDTVQTGEDFEIACSAQDIHENVLFLLYEYKKGLSRKAFGIASGSLNSVNIFHLHPFVDGEGYFETDFFYEPGIYVYEVEMYYCSKVDSSLGISNCGMDFSVSDATKELSKLDPDKLIYQEIVVSGNSIEY